METLAELFDYIDSLEKEPGTYTPDELFEIGRLHKKLPVREKNWEQLTKYIGYPSTSNAYRIFVLRQEKKLGIAPVEEEEMASKESDRFEELYKQKVQIRDSLNSYKSVLRAEARVEAFVQGLKDAAKEMKPIHVKKCDKTVKGTKEAVLMLSDLHIGNSCDNFYNTYNVEIAYDRVSKLINDTINYCRTFEVKTLHVVNLGDMIHGYIHQMSRIQAEMNVTAQVITAADIISQSLKVLKEEIPIVTYRSCVDNHSRMTADYRQNLDEENFGFLIDTIVEERLKDSGIVFAHDNLDPTIMMFTLQNGKLVMAAHGHLEKPDKVIDDFTGAIKTLPDYVLLSHYHASRAKAYNGAKLFINGSIVGTEEYALSKRLFNDPEQLLLIFDKEDNVINININLA